MHFAFETRRYAPVFLCFLMLWLVSCDKRKLVEVTRVGELENVIRDGDMSTHAKLSDFRDQPDVYGLGIATGNDGFITMLAGQPYVSRVDTDRRIIIDSSFNTDATLFLYSTVKKWKPYDIPVSVTTWKQLEQFITNQATRYNVSKTNAFPFLLKGTALSVRWHVLKWRPGIKEITYKKMLTLGESGTLENENIEAIGFYSKESKEIFVHQETVINIFFVNHNHSLAGRIDYLTLDGRLKLYLPGDD